MKLAEKLEDQKKQNRAYVEVRPLILLYLSHPDFLFLPLSSALPDPNLMDSQKHILTSQQFKAQERESQRYRSRKKERAFLKAIPIIPVSFCLLLVLVKLTYSQLPLFSSLLKLMNPAPRI